MSTALVVREPYRAFVQVGARAVPARAAAVVALRGGPAAGAHVHPSARLESGVTVEPGAVIGPRAEIGAGTRDRAPTP